MLGPRARRRLAEAAERAAALRAGAAGVADRVALGGQRAPGVITPGQPKVPEAKIRGSQKVFQWVILGLERVPRVLKGVQRGPMETP